VLRYLCFDVLQGLEKVKVYIDWKGTFAIDISYTATLHSNLKKRYGTSREEKNLVTKLKFPVCQKKLFAYNNRAQIKIKIRNEEACNTGQSFKYDNSVAKS